MRKRRNLRSSSSGPKKEEEQQHENVGEDIISNLPEHILHHIFSLADMKQAIQTCLLSRTWRHFWVSLPTLKFTYNEGRKNKLRNEFMDFVDRVLMFRGNSNIVEFVLVTNNNIDVTNRLNTWILASVIRNAQEITLNTHFPDKFHIHHCLLTCKSLTKLVLNAQSHWVSISLPDSITLHSLKTLSLRLVKFEDEYSTNRLFSNCPILESLTIHFCLFPRINVNISCPLLQHLILSKCRIWINALDLGTILETNFQLCAPNLKSFFWSNNMSIHCTPKNLSSLVTASITVHGGSRLSKENYAPFLVNILRGFHNVEHLTLSASFLEVITGASYLLDSQPTTFCNLKYLMLMGTWRSIDSIHAISYLLKISPNIKTLFVEVRSMLYKPKLSFGSPFYFQNDIGSMASCAMCPVGFFGVSMFINFMFFCVCDKVDYGAPDLLEVQPTQFCNIRCLKMNTLLSKDCIYSIAYFLKISPKVDTLSFKVSYSSDKMHPYWNPDEITSNSPKRGDYWKAVLSLECLLNHVKYFTLCNVEGRINELEFIEILLKNAVLLKKLHIISQKTSYCKEKELEEERRDKFREKVLIFPRASSRVKIMFESSKQLILLC